MHWRACRASAAVVQIKDVYENEWNGRPHLLMVLELMEGGELFDQIEQRAARGETFTERQAASIVRACARAIADLHEQHIAHRDLKPENFLITAGSSEPGAGAAAPAQASAGAQYVAGLGIIKLTDFGFAKSDQCGNLTTPVYTPYYVAPELLNVKSQHSGSYDKQVDLWSLGVIIYILLAGFPPFFSYSEQDRLSPGMSQRIQAGEYDFDDEVWNPVSESAKVKRGEGRMDGGREDQACCAQQQDSPPVSARTLCASC